MREGFEERGRWPGPEGQGGPARARVEQIVRWGGWSEEEAGAKLRRGGMAGRGGMPRVLGCLDARAPSMWIFAGSVAGTGTGGGDGRRWSTKGEAEAGQADRCAERDGSQDQDQDQDEEEHERRETCACAGPVVRRGEDKRRWLGGTEGCVSGRLDVPAVCCLSASSGWLLAAAPLCWLSGCEGTTGRQGDRAGAASERAPRERRKRADGG